MKNFYSHSDKVIIIQQVVPTYRINFFKELGSKIDFELYASVSGLTKRSTVITKHQNFKINLIKKFNFLNLMLFQFLPFNKLLLPGVVIFEFNIRIISNVLLLLLRILAKKKNILWTHGITENMSPLSKLIRIFFMKRVDSIIVYESLAKKELINFGISENKIFVAKNSIDIRQNIELINHNEEKFRITFIGRLIKEKKIALLCEAFLNIVSKIDRSILLTIIGTGEDLNVLKKKYSNKRIKFIGHLDDEKKISHYMNQSLFTVSPDYLGLAIIHSFSYAVPMLVNKFPKKKHSPEIELFDENVNGLWFNGTKKNLESQILYCLTNKKKLQKYGNNGNIKVKVNYGVEQMVECFQIAIENID